jgi:hypothetical protein
MACASAETPHQPVVPQPQADADILRIWVEARAGTGQPVHWVSEGSIYAYPSGERLFGMTGFDSSLVIWPDEPGGEVLHLTRKTFVYTDPDSGDILTEHGGQAVTPIAYPYQLIRYRLEDGLIFADVEQGAAPRVQQIKARDGIRARRMGDSWAFTAPVFLDFPLPSGERYEAWENYDFFIHPEGSVSERHQMSWQRYGDLPDWAGGGKAIYHLLSWRIDSAEDLPAGLRHWAEEQKPMWLRPPADLAEIRTLQSGEGGAGWGD